MLGNPGLAGTGELLCNSLGAWISAFSLHMGIISKNIAELEAIFQGLILAWNLGFKFIHLEIDFMIVLSWLTNDKDISLDVIPLLCDCRNLMECDWTVQVYHIFREANGCADVVAKRGNQQQCILETYETCPAFVCATFVWDMEHLGTTRMCLVKAVMLAVV